MHSLAVALLFISRVAFFLKKAGYMCIICLQFRLHLSSLLRTDRAFFFDIIMSESKMKQIHRIYHERKGGMVR